MRRNSDKNLTPSCVHSKTKISESTYKKSYQVLSMYVYHGADTTVEEMFGGWQILPYRDLDHGTLSSCETAGGCLEEEI